MAKVIPISARKSVSLEIADLAYDFWLARCFKNGSPEQDFLRAVLEVTFGGPGYHTAPQPFLVRRQEKRRFSGKAESARA
jgi:hypothetical protein